MAVAAFGLALESRGPYGSIDDRVATVVLVSKIGADACVTMS